MYVRNSHVSGGHDRWQECFVRMLPRVERLLRSVFAGLDPASRDEAMQNAIVMCVLSYAGLHARGRAHVASAESLVWYAVLQTKCGRVAGGRLNGRDPLSRYAQLRQGADSCPNCFRRPNTWIDTMVEDGKASVPDVVAARLDIRAWLATLCRRTRSIARDLAKGHTTSETASKYGVSSSRISQLRRELDASWQAFQNEPALVSAP